MLLQIRLDLYDIAMMGAGLGALLDLLPLILGFVRKERSYGVFGFLGSIIGGAIMGILLSLPIIGIFTWLILRKPKNTPVEVEMVNQTPVDVKVENSENR